MRFDFVPIANAAAATRRGETHDVNGDAYCLFDATTVQEDTPRGALFAVSDGVSTVRDGQWAAQTTCKRLASFFDRDVQPGLNSLQQLVNEIDWELRGRGKGNAACTLSLLWLTGGYAHVLNIGDSQVLRVRHGELQVLTAPRSMAGGLRNYMGMGVRLNDAMQVWRQALWPGDLFMLLSDGVMQVMKNEELLDTWWEAAGDPKLTVSRIVDDIEARKGEDDATVIVVDILAIKRLLSFPPGGAGDGGNSA